ncbi:MAG: M6 family metalloprotease-like protein [Candidatus Krumholzibacteriia bacterium]
MQPSDQLTIRGRLRAARIPAPAIGYRAGLTLLSILTLLATAFIGLAEAAEPRSWPDLPVRRWDADEVRAMPNGQKMLDQELHRQGEYNRRWRQVHDVLGGQHVSRLSQEMLARRGLGPSSLVAGGPTSTTNKALEPDVLRVLLVRVSFENNRNPNLTTMDPSGDFMLDPLADPGPLEIDPPPHNKAYFESHMQGLTEYYQFMSGGQLIIEGTVLPEGENDSYKLTDVADYGPGASSFWTLENLERLVQDMMTTADAGLIADGGNGLADYDDETPFTYVIFVHSGSDWQSDINGDSPNDIPTFFVTLGEPVDLIGTNPGGNPGKLSECSIIPETTSQDGFPGSIAAAFYHEFGHALGLPDVYNTQNGLPSVGIWDLMDSGTNLPVTLGTITAEGDTVLVSATGVLPPSLSAWCKSYLGWLEMGEVSKPVSSTGDYFLPAVGVPRTQYPLYNAGSGDFNLAYPQAYRAGSSPLEYFLIENRWVPDSVAETPYNDLRFEVDDNTGVSLYLAGLRNGNWTNSGLYDFFMPAGGLLVWHVNAERIANELPNNTINAYGDGLRLVEADGIQDIGVLDAFVLGWFGSWRDPFGGRDQNLMDTGFNDLYIDKFPNSRNFDRSYSGVRLSNMSRRVPRFSSVMKFNATLEPVLDGFPWQATAVDSVEAGLSGGKAVARKITPSSVTPVSLAEQVLIFSDEPGEGWTGGDFATSFYGIRPNGVRRWADVPGRPEGVFQVVDGTVIGAPLMLDHPSDGAEMIWATENGTVGATHLPLGLPPSVLWSSALSDRVLASPLALRWQGAAERLLIATHADSLQILDRAGNVLGNGILLSPDSGPAVSNLSMTVFASAAGTDDRAAAFVEGGWFLVEQDASGLIATPGFVPYERISSAVPQYFAVVPLENESHSLVVYDDEGELGRWNIDSDGTVVALSPGTELDGPLVCAPAVADVDGDGRHDVVLATATRVFGFNSDGLPLRGYPVKFYDLFALPDSLRIRGPLVVADGTGDGINDVFFNTTGGHLLGLNANGRLHEGFPLRWGDVSESSFTIGGETDRVLWLVSSGGYDTGFKGRNAVNGRVSAYGLLPTAPTDERTSEWLGPYGGPSRNGPAGEAKSLGSLAPIASETEQVYLYPNPMSGEDVKVRFFSAGSGAAKIAVYNLGGELVADKSMPVIAGALNEIEMSLPSLVSGMYMARLEYDSTSGRTVRTMTLAVEK